MKTRVFNQVAVLVVMCLGIYFTTQAYSQGMGIGIASPVSVLHVYENTTKVDATAGLTIEQDGTGDAVLQYLMTGGQRWVTGIDNSDGDKFKISSTVDVGSAPRMTIQTTGEVGIGTASPTAVLHLIAGTATAGTAPLKFTSGTNLTTAEAGAMEYDGTSLYFTNGGAQRQELPQVQQSRVTSQFDKTSSTALANIPGLTATLVAGKTYFFQAFLRYSSASTAGGCKTSIGGTCTATSIWWHGELMMNDGSVMQVVSKENTSLGASFSDIAAYSTALDVRIEGLIVCNAAGTLTTQFAQVSSSGTASSILVGSYFIVRQVQ